MDTAHRDERRPAPWPRGRTSADQAPGAADREAFFLNPGQGEPIPAALAAGKPGGLRCRRAFHGVESQLEPLRRWLESLLPVSPARDDLVLVATELGTPCGTRPAAEAASSWSRSSGGVPRSG